VITRENSNYSYLMLLVMRESEQMKENMMMQNKNIKEEIMSLRLEDNKKVKDLIAELEEAIVTMSLGTYQEVSRKKIVENCISTNSVNSSIQFENCE